MIRGKERYDKLKIAKAEVKIINIRAGVNLVLAISFFVLGCLSIAEIVVLESKYVFCINMAVFILMIAALVFEIAIHIRGIVWLKLLYILMWILLGNAMAALVFLPLLVTWQDWKPYDIPLMNVNSGLLMLIFFLKEVVRNWKNNYRKSATPKHQGSQDCYFEELPRMIGRKKRTDIYFDC